MEYLMIIYLPSEAIVSTVSTEDSLNIIFNIYFDSDLVLRMQLMITKG